VISNLWIKVYRKLWIFLTISQSLPQRYRSLCSLINLWKKLTISFVNNSKKGKQFLLLIRHPRVAHIIKSWLIPLCANKYIFRSPYQKDRWALAITCSISSVNLSNLMVAMFVNISERNEHSIDASYQVSVHLAWRFHRRRVFRN
jgi:hypothetical protein